MAVSVFTSATGIDASQTFLDVTSNNIANANTTGFKTSVPNFQDEVYQTLETPGQVSRSEVDLFAPVGVQVGLGVNLGSIGSVFTQGEIQPTGGLLDVAITGEGFFQVAQFDGSIAYTRNGTFTRNQLGQLVTQEGLPLIGPIEIPEDATSVQIGFDGNVSVSTAADATPVVVGQITLARFTNPSGLVRLGNGLFAESPSSAPVVGAGGSPGFGVLEQGVLESSNVDVTTELINLILAQRSFTFNSQAFTIGSDILRATAQLIN